MLEDIKVKCQAADDKHSASSLLDEVVSVVTEFSQKAAKDGIDGYSNVKEFADAAGNVASVVSLKLVEYTSKMLKLQDQIGSLGSGIIDPLKMIYLAIRNRDMGPNSTATKWCQEVKKPWDSMAHNEEAVFEHKALNDLLSSVEKIALRLDEMLIEHNLSKVDVTSWCSGWSASLQFRLKVCNAIKVYLAVRAKVDGLEAASSEDITQMSHLSELLLELGTFEATHRQDIWNAMASIAATEGVDSAAFINQHELVAKWCDEAMEATYESGIAAFVASLQPYQCEDPEWAENPSTFLPEDFHDAALKLVAAATPLDASALAHMAAKNRKDSDGIVITGLAALDVARICAARVAGAALPILPEASARLSTPVSFTALVLNSTHTKQLTLLKEYCVASSTLDKFWAENKDTLEKDDFRCSSGTTCQS